MDASRLERAARALLAVVDGREKGLRGYYIDAKRFDALRAALALPADAPEGAGEAVAWRNVEAALREWEGRVVIRAKMEEAKEGGIAYAREQESRALMVALNAIHAYAAHPTPRAEAASAVPAWRDSFPPTHYCRECKALWRRWPDGSWSLVTAACGKCCDNVPMGEQLAPLASEYPTLQVERPTALATPGEVAPGAPNQAGVTAGETAPPPPSTPASAEAVAWWRLCLERGEWLRDDGVTRLAVRVHDAADLSCQAMRQDAMQRAVAHALRAPRHGGAA